MSTSQDVFLGPNPPQFEALTADAQLVTLQIGGNDIGFGQIVDECTTASPFGQPCRNRYAPNWPAGPDELAARIDAAAPKVAAVLQELRVRAPQARVLVDLGRGARMVVVQHRQVRGLGRLFVGSTATATAAHADCPVISVTHDWKAGDAPGEVVVGVHEGGEPREVLEAGFSWAAATDASFDSASKVRCA